MKDKQVSFIKGSIVKVNWVDPCRYCQGWTDIDEIQSLIEDHMTDEIESVGVVLKDTRNYVVLRFSYREKSADCIGVYAILKSNIKSYKVYEK